MSSPVAFSCAARSGLALSNADLKEKSVNFSSTTSPYAVRPGLERYAEPAPEDFGRYRTFCGT